MTLPPRWRSHLAYLVAAKIVESAEQPGSTGWSIIAVELRI
jgi:hypothetical protein